MTRSFNVLGALRAGRRAAKWPIQKQQKPFQRPHSTTSSASARMSPLLSSATGLAVGVVATTIGIAAFSDRKATPVAKSSEDTANSTAAGRYADKPTMLLAVKEIQDALGEDAVSLDADDLESHGYSDWSTAKITNRPMAVIMPKSTEEVSEIARICTKYKVPMIPFGAGSSVEGNVTAPYSGFSIDLSKMNKIIAFHEEDMDVVVQPGVNWVNLNEELKPTGLFLPLDPSPTAYIGGMVATNCSGTNAMRYGTMKDWVINLTVVLADGSVIKTRHRPRKTSAGYNLTALFTGSEGTLGIITEITLKLAIVPSHFGVATTSFPTVKDAAQGAIALMRKGIPLAALELMDGVQMGVINKNGGAGGKMWEELPTLFIKFSGSENVVRDSMAATRALTETYGGTNFTLAEDKQAMDDLWSARKQALWAMLAVRPEGTEIWSTDVAVPLSRLAEIVDESSRNASKLGLFSTVLGHVGDGNFHQSVMYNPQKPEQVEGVRKCVDTMVINAIKMEGTVSGEHGIGLSKKHCLEKELGPETIGIMKTLKRSLDPYWLLNPGKVIDF